MLIIRRARKIRLVKNFLDHLLVSKEDRAKMKLLFIGAPHG
jgi:hypothetical protein